MEEHNTIKLIGKKDFLTAKKPTQQLLPNKSLFPKSYLIWIFWRKSKFTHFMLKSKSLNVSICPNSYIHLIQEEKLMCYMRSSCPLRSFSFVKTGMVNILYKKMEHYQKCQPTWSAPWGYFLKLYSVF